MSSTSDSVPNSQLRSPENSTMSDTERWGSLIGGGAMVLMGLQQASLRGVLLAIAGGGLAYRAATSETSLKSAVESAMQSTDKISVEQTVTIANRTPEELYHIWRNFENLPLFMKHIQSVKVLDEKRSHWVAQAPLNMTLEWDAEIITDQKNHLISWTSVEDADIENSGFVRFQTSPGNRGTEVKVVLEYKPPGGKLTDAFAHLVGQSAEQQIRDDIRNFKMLAEAGEIATIEGQPQGGS